MQQYIPLFGRILIGLSFLVSGLQQLFNNEETNALIVGAGVPYPFSWCGLLAVCSIEALLGVALMVGFKTRYVAALLALIVTALTILFNSDAITGSGQLNFLKNMAILGGLLYVTSYGSGKYSVDSK